MKNLTVIATSSSLEMLLNLIIKYFHSDNYYLQEDKTKPGKRWYIVNRQSLRRPFEISGRFFVYKKGRTNIRYVFALKNGMRED